MPSLQQFIFAACALLSPTEGVSSGNTCKQSASVSSCSSLLQVGREVRKNAISASLLKPQLLAVPSLEGHHFRTSDCSAKLSDDEVQSGMDVVDHLQLVDTSIWQSRSPRIACMVYSFHEKRQQMRDSFATWAQDCDIFLPFSDETFHDIDAGFTTIEVHPANHVEKNLVGKVHAALVEVSKRLKANQIEFDYLTISGDDSFWIIPNLRSFLSTHPAVLEGRRTGKGSIFGRPFAINGNIHRSFTSGAGYVIDKAALDDYLTCPEGAESWAEDVAMADCLRKSHVPINRTQDTDGREIFHMFDPQGMENVDYTAPGWVKVYEEPFQPIIPGIEGISPHSVVFHYVTGDYRTAIFNRLFKNTVCQHQTNMSHTERSAMR